ncbi:hypothetical protein EDD18DRAFT_1357203 [Armillaria luteobubalina]|uniref:Uncharacterized protein n=1 Tax=Armillaria luteobubalina TaxID=153913 RepID=A0AA39UK91_9AGAR|nr:hypothetical protein EDD18DRAFT_1357203 [Armillaria luteobubalina]
MLRKSFISNRVTPEAAGLVALADLSTIVTRTALTGTATYLDALVLAPGLYQQQTADEVNHGELPTTGAMATGYVFHVENPTVRYLETIGPAGLLVTTRVSPKLSLDMTLSYALCPAWTITVFILLGAIEDWRGFGVLRMLVLATLIDVVVIERRSHMGRKGAHEIGQRDLLVLLSQDRWMRLQESADDLKAVTTGQWL